MAFKPRPEIANFCAAYQHDVDTRVRTLTRAVFFMPTRSGEIVAARNLPVTGYTVAAYNRLHGETGQEYADVAIKSIRRYCRIDAAQRSQMKLIVSGQDGIDLTVLSVSGEGESEVDAASLASPDESVLVQFNDILNSGIEDEAIELEMQALIAGRDVAREGVDTWSIDMPAHAEAALLKTVDETDHEGNWTINRAVQICHFLHLFEQVADVSLASSDGYRISLSDLD